MSDNPKALALLDALLGTAKKKGADAADAVFIQSTSMQATCRKQVPEEIERSESAGLGLRVWKGNRQAVVSSTDINENSFGELAERVVAMASASTEDEHSFLAESSVLASSIPELDLADKDEPSAEWLMEQGMQAEAAALDIKGITNSEGGDASFSKVTVALATSPKSGKGFAHSYDYTSSAISASVLAGEGTGMERDYDYAYKRRREDLPAPESIGKKAAERALKRLNPKKVKTVEVPVVFDPRVGRSLLGNFTGAINGAAIARKTSFLKDAMGEKLFGDNITIVDDPHMKRGLASRPFDAEGIGCGALSLVENGELKSWILDLRTASKLGLKSTGHAARGLASPPSPSSSNVYMKAGQATPEELIAEIKDGFYITETFGMGVNLVTGDYSQGASGFWIENGKMTYPVSEVTIAGHLKDMFKNLTPANDLEFRYSANVPTLKIAKMTVAGT